MIAKTLERRLGSEMKIPEPEMVQRFQKLREARLLPTSRGRNAEHLTIEAVVSGILSIVGDRPAFAGLTVNMLRHLQPVGGAGDAFAQAKTFGQALAAALSDAKLLQTVLEIRVSDSEIFKNANGRAAIFYAQGDEEAVTYYVHHTAKSLLGPGRADNFNPRDLIGSMIRETVILPPVLQQISRQIRDEEEYSSLMGHLDTAAEQRKGAP
jgi:hypothetical protein